MLAPETLHRARQLLGYQFQDPSLLDEALTHSSAADSRLRSNERMEFLGDAVLDLVVCDELYQRFPDYFEGEMTKLKSAVVSARPAPPSPARPGSTSCSSSARGSRAGD